MDALKQFISDLKDAVAKGDDVAFIDCNPADFTYDPSYGQRDSRELLQALMAQWEELDKLRGKV